jgi:hypothetical protein
VEKPLLHLTPRKAGRPPGSKNDPSRRQGTLTIRYDERLKADLDFLRDHYRQTEYASLIRMAIAAFARLAREQGEGKGKAQP